VAPPATDHTISRSRPARRRSAGANPALFVVIQAEDPGAGGARIDLRGIDQVSIGRGGSRAVRARDGVLRIDVPDPRVSTDHARLQRVLGKWTIEDASSKNGLFVEGQRVARQTLADGDWIELGHTFLRFRDFAGADDDTAAADERTLLPWVQATLNKVRLVAAKSVPVLLGGETGTGKEIIARQLHALSGRAGAFVAVNCGAVPANLVESVLFGHRKGAFSGAHEDRPGVVVSAQGGTLLLDEVGDLPLSQQAALLRVLQEKEVVPVGESRSRKIDVRFVAATHQDLNALVNRARFRGDLLARLDGTRIVLPPLRERIEDLGILVASILDAAGARGFTLSRDAAWAMCRHSWPFNVRELEQALHAALAVAPSRRIELAHLPDALRAVPAVNGERARGEQLIACLRQHRGNLAAVARALGTSRTQIHRLLQRYGIDPDAHR
jgi:DNA-binding NtrC family response regulator